MALARACSPERGDHRRSCGGASRPCRASYRDRLHRSRSGCSRSCPTRLLRRSRLQVHPASLVPRSGDVLVPLRVAHLFYRERKRRRHPAPRTGTSSAPRMRSRPRTSFLRIQPKCHRADAAPHSTENCWMATSVSSSSIGTPTAFDSRSMFAASHGVNANVAAATGGVPAALSSRKTSRAGASEQIRVPILQPRLQSHRVVRRQAQRHPPRRPLPVDGHALATTDAGR